MQKSAGTKSPVTEHDRASGSGSPRAPVTERSGGLRRSRPAALTDKRRRPSSSNRYGTPAVAPESVSKYATRPLPPTPTSNSKMAGHSRTMTGPNSTDEAQSEHGPFKGKARCDHSLLAKANKVHDRPPTPFPSLLPTPGSLSELAPSPKMEAMDKAYDPYDRPPTPFPDLLSTPGSPSKLAPSPKMEAMADGPQATSSIPIESVYSTIDVMPDIPGRRPAVSGRLEFSYVRCLREQAGVIGPPRSKDGSKCCSEVPPVKKLSRKQKLLDLFKRKQPTSSAGKKPISGPKAFKVPPIPFLGTKTSFEPNHGIGGSLLDVVIPPASLGDSRIMFERDLRNNPPPLAKGQASVPKPMRSEDNPKPEKVGSKTIRKVASFQPAAGRPSFSVFPSPSSYYGPGRTSPGVGAHISPAHHPSTPQPLSSNPVVLNEHKEHTRTAECASSSKHRTLKWSNNRPHQSADTPRAKFTAQEKEMGLMSSNLANKREESFRSSPSPSNPLLAAGRVGTQTTTKSAAEEKEMGLMSNHFTNKRGEPYRPTPSASNSPLAAGRVGTQTTTKSAAEEKEMGLMSNHFIKKREEPYRPIPSASKSLLAAGRVGTQTTTNSSAHTSRKPSVALTATSSKTTESPPYYEDEDWKRYVESINTITIAQAEASSIARRTALSKEYGEQGSIGNSNLDPFFNE
ncbi:hypothetical protein GGS20DRAFT_418164 [Poronia punctata]|nr:hypothetical protein GGS20DRAFT_418164 [Poronia punctata]